MLAALLPDNSAPASSQSTERMQGANQDNLEKNHLLLNSLTESFCLCKLTYLQFLMIQYTHTHIHSTIETKFLSF